MLELNHVGYTTEDGMEILKDITLKIDERFVAITGPNGGGKSTLAKVIAGIYQPTEGTILLDGVDITNMSITDRAKEGISFAFQQPVRFKGLSVRDILTLAFDHKPDEKELGTVLQKVGLCAADYLDRELNSNLSGGEMKRIEIATVLARHTKVTVFDEPEAGIDLWSFSSLIDVFTDMKKSLNGTLVIISHQERILSIADEIIVVDGGRVARQGSSEQIMADLLTRRPGCENCDATECVR